MEYEIKVDMNIEKLPEGADIDAIEIALAEAIAAVAKKFGGLAGGEVHLEAYHGEEADKD